METKPKLKTPPMPKPTPGIDGPKWCYPGDIVFMKRPMNGRLCKFVCSTGEDNSLEYGAREIGYFKKHPSELRRTTPSYERHIIIGFCRNDVITGGQQIEMQF